MKTSKKDVTSLADKIKKLKQDIKRCTQCHNWDLTDPCAICSDDKRDGSVICVVAYAQDIPVIEKTKQHKGVYHVLEGLIKPTEGLTPDKLTIEALINRVKSAKEPIREIIMALNSNTEGEATILYLVEQLKPLGITITRLAKGLPNGSDLEYADEVTLTSALQGRQAI